jgi:hypothetical protein
MDGTIRNAFKERCFEENPLEIMKVALEVGVEL